MQKNAASTLRPKVEGNCSSCVSEKIKPCRCRLPERQLRSIWRPPDDGFPLYPHALCIKKKFFFKQLCGKVITWLSENNATVQSIKHLDLRCYISWVVNFLLRFLHVLSLSWQQWHSLRKKRKGEHYVAAPLGGGGEKGKKSISNCLRLFLFLLRDTLWKFFIGAPSLNCQVQ